MKKAIAILLSAALLAAAFSGCVIRSQGDSPAQPSAAVPPASTAAQTPGTTGGQAQETEHVEPTDPAIPKRLSQEEELAIQFVTALHQKDYDTALGLLSSSVYSDAPVFTEDIEWALPRTDFKVLKDLDAQTAEYSTVLDHNGNVLVTVRDASGLEETVTVRTEIPTDGDGSPRVNGSGDFYRTKFGFRTPGNVQVEIGGIAIDKKYIKQKNSGSISMYTDWSIPFIGIKDKEIRVYSDCFDATLTFTPKAWSDPQQDGDVRFLPNYQEDDVLQTVRTLWQDMYSLAQVPETKASDLYPYIAADAAPDTAQIILDAYRQLDDKDIKMTQAVFRTGSVTFWANDHCLAVNFGYELTWGTSYNMRRLSSIILAREGETWKIYRVTDSGLFSSLNYFTSEW